MNLFPVFLLLSSFSQQHHQPICHSPHVEISTDNLWNFSTNLKNVIYFYEIEMLERNLDKNLFLKKHLLCHFLIFSASSDLVFRPNNWKLFRPDWFCLEGFFSTNKACVETTNKPSGQTDHISQKSLCLQLLHMCTDVCMHTHTPTCLYVCKCVHSHVLHRFPLLCLPASYLLCFVVIHTIATFLLLLLVSLPPFVSSSPRRLLITHHKARITQATRVHLLPLRLLAFKIKKSFFFSPSSFARFAAAVFLFNIP